jgi:tetratricopeptide (TPR) repeat protein
MRDAGAYNDDLKACQLGLMKLGDFPDSPGTVEAAAWLNAESAVALAAMGHRDKADRAIKTAREQPMSNVFDDADMDYRTSCVYRHLGQVDAAQAVLVSSLRKWAAEGSARRDSVLSDIGLAIVHVQTGQGDAAALSQHAIAKTASVRSGRARAALAQLTQALSARPDTTSRDLARRAQTVQQKA